MIETDAGSLTPQAGALQAPVTLLPVRGYQPTFGEGCWLAPGAVVVGQVTMGARCTVWFGAIVRGDVHAIDIGDETNIQDGAVLHVTYERASLRIGRQVSIAHKAVVHGCTIGDRVLVGMGAIIMDHARVDSEVLVAAGAVVTPGQHLPSGFVYAGTPARPLRPLSDHDRDTILATAARYPMYAGWYREAGAGIWPKTS